MVRRINPLTIVPLEALHVVSIKYIQKSYIFTTSRNKSVRLGQPCGWMVAQPSLKSVIFYGQSIKPYHLFGRVFTSPRKWGPLFLHLNRHREAARKESTAFLRVGSEARDEAISLSLRVILPKQNRIEKQNHQPKTNNHLPLQFPAFKISEISLHLQSA